MRYIKDFFADLNFDRIDSFRLNHLNNISCTQKYNAFEILDENGNELPNGILDSNFNLNPTAELVTSTKDVEIIHKLKNLFTAKSDNPVNPEVPLFRTALLFYHNDRLIKGINISFNQGLFSSTANEHLVMSESDFELFRLFFYVDLKHELFETANYYGAIGNKWQQHRFPNSFYYNPHSKVYETSIISTIICQNYEPVKVTIETNGKKISATQLRRIFYVMGYPFALRDKMNRMILEYYNQMANDYSLPTLTEETIDNLKYFIQLAGVTIYEGDESDILLSFKNWDTEHGLHIYINEVNQKMEFAF